MYAIRLLEKAKNLPPGHIDKRKAEKAVQKEYNNCLEIAHKWHKRFSFVLHSPNHALQFCNEICDLLGEEKLKKIVINSKEVSCCAGAHYCNRTIHFKWSYIPFGTLMHELAHHFNPWDCSHGKYYCQMLDFIYKVAYTHVTGKQPKKDW